MHKATLRVLTMATATGTGTVLRYKHQIFRDITNLPGDGGTEPKM